MDSCEDKSHTHHATPHRWGKGEDFPAPIFPSLELGRPSLIA